MLEMYAVERNPQPLELKSGEMGAPDCPSLYSSAFTVRHDSIAGSSDEQGAVTEQRMISTDGHEVPWFKEPLTQKFEGGIPVILPFAPSIVVKSSFRQVTRAFPVDVERQLLQPVVDVTCFVHPQACFWWSEEDEERCLNHIVEYAKRIPYALPFNLYLRVDTTKDFRDAPSRVEEMEKRLAEKSHYFNLRRFVNLLQQTPRSNVMCLCLSLCLSLSPCAGVLFLFCLVSLFFETQPPRWDTGSHAMGFLHREGVVDEKVMRFCLLFSGTARHRCGAVTFFSL
ncbi:hypothetical protein TcBrA4_0055680 [Trypanosoma cruzi]|nr:hypothetical protein TcBrA4_0055680 [Trypanosoma cruzi]